MTYEEESNEMAKNMDEYSEHIDNCSTVYECETNFLSKNSTATNDCLEEIKENKVPY